MSGSQKFISRNRAPRVQIEYDVELYGATKKVQLPFVMGVMSDLSGKSEVAKGSVSDRAFLEIDIDNFDSRMQAMKPRAAFSVPNTLTGEGNLSVDLVFEKMSDFSPAEVANKVEPLRKLLEARTQLANLMTYMDGKAGAEELIERLVANPDHLRALALGDREDDTQKAAFEAMKAAAPKTAAPKDTSGDILAAMAASAPEDPAPDTSVEDALKGLAESAHETNSESDGSADILAGLAESAPEDTAPDTSVADALASVAAGAEETLETPDKSEDILKGLAAAAPLEDIEEDQSADVLAALADSAEPEADTPNASEDILADLALDVPEDSPADTSIDDALAGLAESAVETPSEEGGQEDVLADMAAFTPEPEAETDGADDILAGLADDAADDPAEPSGVEDLLADMADAAPLEEEADTGALDALLGDIADTAEDPPEDTGLDDLLSDMADAAPEDEPDETGLEALLSDVAENTPEEGTPSDESDVDALLADLAEDLPEEGEDISIDALLENVADTPAEEDPLEDETTDILASLSIEVPEDAPDEDLNDLLSGMADEAEPEDEESGLEAVLEGLAETAPEDADGEHDGLDDLLADMADTDSEEDTDTALDDVLAGLELDDEDQDAPSDDLDDLLASVADAPDEDEREDDLDALLAGIAEDDSEEDDLDALLNSAEESDETELDDLLASVAEDEDDDDTLDLDALLADDSDESDDLDSLLAEIADEDEDSDDDLDALLSDISEDEDDDLDALLADDGSEDTDLDALLSEDETEAPALAPEPAKAAPPPKPKKPAFQPDFGSMSAAKLQHEPGSRRKFRIAVLGDFSGRGNKGALETGEALGKRKAFKLDFDTMDDVIARFRTTLTLPLGTDGSAVDVALNELDDLHPDELFENVELFNELNMLRRDLKSGRNFEQNVERMQAWGGAFGDFKALSKKRSKGAEAPADLRLTDFQNLIGDETPKPEASAASDLISRIIGPHIVAAADNGAEAMIAAVDAALSTAMSSVLHHPDFQTIEAAWRSIELLVRRVEASAELEVVVYDISVEEFTADLAAQDDVSQSGLYDMLVENPMMDESAGPISAVIGLYTWEETPTHAELLARMARISAQMDAPFISAISTGFMSVKPEDRHPLVQKTWGALGEMPEAKYLGLASPRFMLRMPYGKKTEPLDRFDYEEFNVKEGMRSMLMANPAVLVAVLLAETKVRQGGEMSLGSIMSLNDMPFHFMTDQYGDQVALPCTERLLNVSGAADVVARGFMPVISVQGQNMVKLASFQAVGGGELLGIWAGESAKDMKTGNARMETSVGISKNAKQVGAPPDTAAASGEAGSVSEDDYVYGFDSDLGKDDSNDLDLDFDLSGDDDLGLDLDLNLGEDDDGLDDLLAGFGDDEEGDDDDMDADLAALLGDL